MVMLTSDDDYEHRRQLREAGRLLSNPPASVDELLHILDQLGKLLEMVDQSPNNIMKEALCPPMNALVDRRLLEHSSTDVKVSVAVCFCEITRITAPEPPYSDDDLKGIFQCIVSSLENLSDNSSRSYGKRLSILDTVLKVRSCVLMLDLECDDLIVKLFEHFLNSVRDHHIGKTFSLMVNIMVLVLEESEDISLDMLKPLLASVKNNSEGVLPMARKLGEEVIKKSAHKIQPYLNETVTILGDSLSDYSQVLTSICEGTTDFVEHNDESASVQPKLVDSKPSVVSLDDAAQVISNGDMVTGNEENVDHQQSKNPEGTVDHPGSNLISKLNTNDSLAENSENVESKPDTITKSAEPFVSETIHDENIAEKSPEIAVTAQKPLESEVENAPSQSGSQQEEPQSKINTKKRNRSKKQGSSQTDHPSTVAVLTKVNEASSEPDMRSPKRARKKTAKAEDNKPSVTTGSDVEPSKNSGKNVETSDSGPKPAKRSGKKVGGGGSVPKKPKLSGKKVPESKKSKQEDKVEAGNSEVKPAKPSRKKDNEIDSDAKPLKPSGKKGQKSKVITKPSEDIANKDEDTNSDNKPLKLSENKEEEIDSDHKRLNLSENKEDEETDSDNIPLKLSAKRGNKSSSVVKSLAKNKDGKKQGLDKNVEEKNQTKSLSDDDDGMDVSLQSVLIKATKRKGNLEGALSTGSKRKRSVTKKKVTETMKYDDSLVGQKVKVWWPEDKMYYEGVIESFDSEEKKHKVLYLDGEDETLNLKTEKWEILKDFSTPNKEVAVDVQDTDILPKITGSSVDESKVNTKEAESKEDKETKKGDKKGASQKIVYSRGKKGSKSKTKSPDDSVKESEGVDGAEDPKSEKEKSTETLKTGSKTGKKKRR